MVIVEPDVLDSYVRTLDWLEPRVAAISEAELRNPTPCSEWNVEALLNHLLWTMTSFAGLGEHGCLDEHRIRPPVSGSSYLEPFQLLAESGRTAWSEAGALERMCDFPFLGRAPGGVVLGVHATDLLIHGWDLARATGQDDRMDQDCAVFALHFSQQVFVGDRRRDSYFREPVHNVDLDNVQAILIGYSGRSVNWIPGGRE